MSVKANWFTETGLPAAQDDPFVNFVEQPMIPRVVEDVGHPIDLSAPEPRLRQRLIELVNSEGDLTHKGVACAIRERSDTSCCSCPMRGLDATIAGLCELGVEQEQILTTLAVHRIRGRTVG